MSEVQIAIIDQEDTQITLAVPGVQGPAGAISSGGSANQVFYKVSGTNYDAGWTFIGNANVDAAAAIAGTKISPNFGSQTIATTGVFSHALGAAATPSITFTGDLNTGIFSPGADQVAVATNGVERINIEADGDINIDGGGVFYDATNNRLAIGTTNPSSLLHLSGSVCFLVLNATTANSNNIMFQISGTTKAYIGLAGNLGGSDNDLGFRAESGNNQVFYIGAAEKARIDSSGRLLVGTTTQVANVNGGILQLGSGITFPATAVAASDANTLDDYEEGTWTFAIATTTGSVTVSSTANNCWYIKIGALVTVGGNVTVGSVSSPTGAIIVTLPFAVTDLAESAEYNAGVVTIGTSVSKNTNDFALLAQGGAEMRIYIADVSLLSSGNANAQQLQANSIIHFQLSYYSA